MNWRGYARLMRFDRPVGVYLLLWPTMSALWIAGDGHPDWGMVLVFILGTVILRALGCVMNDWADRAIDGHVSRTKTRPIPSGDITPRQAIVCLCVLIGFSAILALSFLRPGTILLAMIGLGLALIYPLTKRFFAYPQLVLGLAFSWGIPMAFWQLQQQLPFVCWLFFATTAVWTFVYDTQYAQVDADEDRYLPIHSSALSLGRYTALVIRVGQVFIWLSWIVLGLYQQFDFFYFVTCFIALCFFIYQDRCVIKKTRTAYFSAFLSNHWVGLVLFIGIFVATNTHGSIRVLP